MKVLSIGSSLLETTCPINELIGENKTMHLSERHECGGGHAGNIAYLMAKWGVESYVASMLGADDAASKIKKDFETIGVKTEYIETSYDKPTDKSLVLVNATSKNKTVFELSSNATLKKYSFGMEPDLIISDGKDLNATVAAFDKYPKALSFLIATRVSNEVLELGKYAKYIVFNKGTAEEFTNIQIDYNNSATLVNIYNKLKQKFSKAEIVVTLGERGSLYALNAQVKILPPVRVGIVDTNGAGDTFGGAFAYSIGRGFDLEKAVTYATIAASLSTTKLTSRLSIPSLTEVSNYYESKFGKKEQAQTPVQNAQPTNSNQVNTTAPINQTPVTPNVTPTPMPNHAPVPSVNGVPANPNTVPPVTPVGVNNDNSQNA